jgi:hypothetical protein
LAELLGKLDSEMSGVDSKLSAFDSKLSAFEARLVRWMFLFWVGTLGTLIALLKF